MFKHWLVFFYAYIENVNERRALPWPLFFVQAGILFLCGKICLCWLCKQSNGMIPQSNLTQFWWSIVVCRRCFMAACVYLQYPSSTTIIAFLLRCHHSQKDSVCCYHCSIVIYSVIYYCLVLRICVYVFSSSYYLFMNVFRQELTWIIKLELAHVSPTARFSCLVILPTSQYLFPCSVFYGECSTFLSQPGFLIIVRFSYKFYMLRFNKYSIIYMWTF